MLKSVCAAILAILVFTTTVHAAGIDSALIVRPKGTTPYAGDEAKLLARGEQLWNDKRLSGKGKTACSSCHRSPTRMFKKSFMNQYPHPVRMVSRKAGLDAVTMEGMVQFCMLVPMKAQPLPWNSEELAALTAYSAKVAQKAYIEAMSK